MLFGAVFACPINYQLGDGPTVTSLEYCTPANSRDRRRFKALDHHALQRPFGATFSGLYLLMPKLDQKSATLSKVFRPVQVAPAQVPERDAYNGQGLERSETPGPTAESIERKARPSD